MSVVGEQSNAAEGEPVPAVVALAAARSMGRRVRMVGMTMVSSYREMRPSWLLVGQEKWRVERVKRPRVDRRAGFLVSVSLGEGLDLDWRSQRIGRQQRELRGGIRG
jgi:hypothetical protein